MKKLLSITLILGVMIGTLFILSGCSINKVKYDKEEIIKSPNGKYTITLKYDNVSRPYIFKDHKIIFSYDGPGFNETVYWDVEWLSEDKILLYLKSPQKEKYNNEKYYISID